jgi:hypothetical protein
MKRDDMIKLFEHIGARQASHGVDDAFRFKKVLSSRKKGSLQEASYHDTNPGNPDPAPAPVPQRNIQATTNSGNSEPAPAPAPIQETLYSFNDTDMPETLYSFNTHMLEGPSSQEPHVPEQQRSRPTLTLDPAYNIDQPIFLDPSLDPELLAPSTQQWLTPAFTGWAPAFQYPTPESERTYRTPQTVTPATTPSRQGGNLTPLTPRRRRGKNADELAIEEAQILLSQQKRRR